MAVFMTNDRRTIIPAQEKSILRQVTGSSERAIKMPVIGKKNHLFFAVRVVAKQPWSSMP